MNFSQTLLRAIRSMRLARTRIRNPLVTIDVGDDFSIAPGSIMSRRSSLRAGDRVSIGPRLTLLAHLSVGNDTMISSNVGIIGNDHPFDSTDKVLTDFPNNNLATVRIEGDSLIGYGSTLIGNITIGYGAIVGAGSVVTADVPANTVVAGSPAKAVRRRRELK